MEFQVGTLIEGPVLAKPSRVIANLPEDRALVCAPDETIVHEIYVEDGYYREHGVDIELAAKGLTQTIWDLHCKKPRYRGGIYYRFPTTG